MVDSLRKMRLALEPAQAVMLASWLRIAAAQLDKNAGHLRSCGHSFAQEAEINRAQAERARRLAKELSDRAARP